MKKTKPQSITLIKLGGAVITNKEVPMMVQKEVLKQLTLEIVEARKKTGGLFIVGHGQGSFGHAPALRYRTADGFVSGDSVMGMAITQDSAAQLNRIVVRAFLREQLPAASFLFSNSLITHENKPKHWCGQVLLEYLQKGILPITGGDVIVDEKVGCTIWSTEKVLAYIATQLPKEKYVVERIIHVTQVAGVLDASGAVVPHITRKNQESIRAFIKPTKGFDVTGGMWHKIEESLELADKGIESVILSGETENQLYNCLVGKPFQGTIITP